MSFVTIRPSTAQGSIAAPPSKSMAHRLLIAAGLSEGVSTVRGVAPSEDVLATIDCLEALGAVCRYDHDTVTVTGIGGIPGAKQPQLPCRECGSTLRFFIPIAMLGEERATFTGSERLMSRPLTVYEELFSERKLLFSMSSNTLTVKGPLPGGCYTVKGNVSSQFISGLLFALPLLKETSEIRILPPIESRSYIDLTLSALKEFGIEVAEPEPNRFVIPGAQRYHAHTVSVEGDYSNAAFFDALATLGDPVSVTGLLESSLQGDRVYRDCLSALKAGTPTLSLADCPDLAPILMTVAACLNGAVFTDTARLAIKESDRGAAMAEELLKCGIRCSLEKNRITVYAGGLHAPNEMLCAHNDHRIVMALSVLLTRVGGSLAGIEAVKKSFPDFFERLLSLGIPLTFHQGEAHDT